MLTRNLIAFTSLIGLTLLLVWGVLGFIVR